MSPLSRFLQQNPSVKFVHLQWIDLSGVSRSYMLSAPHTLQKLADPEDEKPYNASCVTLRLLPTGNFGARFKGLLRDRLWPDWASLRVMRFFEGGTHAVVMCAIEEQEGTEEKITGSGFAVCPRTVLKKALREAREMDGLEFLCGFEVEFHLLRTAGMGEGQPTGGFISSGAFDEPETLRCLEDISTCLMDSGIQLRAVHAEAGLGQFELTTEPLGVLEAIDELVYIRRTITVVARRHGFQATMYPVLGEAGATNGAHCHFSISDATQEVADKFLAGYLKRLPALCAFGLASYDSYERVSEGKGQTGKWVAWGTENKDLPVRKMMERIGYWEFRCADFTANPYAQLAAYITAGCLGVREGQELRWKDPQAIVAWMEPADKKTCGMNAPMPTSLEAALAALKVAVEEKKLTPLGEPFLNGYLMHKTSEEAALKEMGDLERRKLLTKIY